MSAKKSKQQNNSPTTQQLGEMVKSIYESGYLDRNTTYKMSFIKGVLGGLGGVIGATIVVTLLIWLLSVFQNVPLLGRFVDNVQDTIQTEKR